AAGHDGGGSLVGIRQLRGCDSEGELWGGERDVVGSRDLRIVGRCDGGGATGAGGFQVSAGGRKAQRRVCRGADEARQGERVAADQEKRRGGAGGMGSRGSF